MIRRFLNRLSCFHEYEDTGKVDVKNWNFVREYKCVKCGKKTLSETPPIEFYDENTLRNKRNDY